MGFSWDLTGPRDEVIDQMAELDLQWDEMAGDVRDLVADYLESAADAGPGLQYRVKAEGHSATGEVISLTLEVGVVPLNAAGEATVGRHRLTEEGRGDDSISVLNPEMLPA